MPESPNDERSRSPVLPPFTIVLLGGIASGKSTVAALLEKRGALVLDADRMAHDELANPDVIAAVSDRFGPGVLGADGRVDRKALGAIVFGDKPKLAELEKILHPRVYARIAARLAELATPRGTTRRVVILDVPLAGETSQGKRPLGADLVLFVDASLETRRKRARELRGWSEGELDRRETRQLSTAEKRAMADAVVNNDRGVQEAESDVERIWSSLIGPRLQAA